MSDEDANKTMQTAIDHLAINHKDIKPILKNINVTSKNLSITANQYTKQITAAVQFLKSQNAIGVLSAINQLNSEFRKVAVLINTVLITRKDDIDKFVKSVSALATIDWNLIINRQYEAVMFAAQHGWFAQPEFDLSQISELSIAATANNNEMLNQKFSVFIEDCEVEILDRLLLDYPDREHLINEAFSLHREARYYASIPLFLMLAEGIGFGKTSFSVFNTSQNKPEVAKYFKTIKSKSRSIEDMFSRPLVENHPLSRNKPGKLNRHTVLHGKDLAYGTKINSLQALSFLGNAGWIFSLENENLAAKLRDENDLHSKESLAN